MGKCIKLWQRARDREIDEGSGVAVTQQTTTTTTHRIDIVVTITFLIYMKNRIGALTQVREKMSNNIAKLEEEIPDAKKKQLLQHSVRLARLPIHQFFTMESSVF